MSSSVARLHRALLEAMRRHRPDAPHGTVTVAEIYQDLVPYRTVRSALGFALNADYEHALLQLLAGVDDLARIEPAEAREALRLELDSPNPNTGVFRGYAACDVVIAPLDDLADDAAAEPPVSSGSGWSAPPPDLEVVVTAPSAPGPRAPRPAPPARNQPAEAGRAPQGSAAPHRATCRACGHQLPTERSVRFCPHCGEDQQVQKCVKCGDRLEPGWKYCVTCGAAVRT